MDLLSSESRHPVLMSHFVQLLYQIWSGSDGIGWGQSLLLTNFPPSVSLPGCGLREQELVLVLRGGPQPHRGPALPAARPVQGPGLHQSGGAGRGRAPEVCAGPIPHGRVGKLPAGLHCGQGQRRGPGYGSDQQHQVRHIPVP